MRGIIIFLIFVAFFRVITLPDLSKIYFGKKLKITGKVYKEPIRYNNLQVVNIEGLDVKLDLYPKVFYGDNLVVEGVMGEGELTEAKLISVKRGGYLYHIREKLINF